MAKDDFIQSLPLIALATSTDTSNWLRPNPASDDNPYLRGFIRAATNVRLMVDSRTKPVTANVWYPTTEFPEFEALNSNTFKPGSSYKECISRIDEAYNLTDARLDHVEMREDAETTTRIALTHTRVARLDKPYKCKIKNLPEFQCFLELSCPIVATVNAAGHASLDEWQRLLGPTGTLLIAMRTLNRFYRQGLHDLVVAEPSSARDNYAHCARVTYSPQAAKTQTTVTLRREENIDKGRELVKIQDQFRCSVYQLQQVAIRGMECEQHWLRRELLITIYKQGPGFEYSPNEAALERVGKDKTDKIDWYIAKWTTAVHAFVECVALLELVYGHTRYLRCMPEWRAVVKTYWDHVDVIKSKVYESSTPYFKEQLLALFVRDKNAKALKTDDRQLAAQHAKFTKRCAFVFGYGEYIRQQERAWVARGDAVGLRSE